MRSVGYRGTALDEVPFDSSRNVIPHNDGRVHRALQWQPEVARVRLGPALLATMVAGACHGRGDAPVVDDPVHDSDPADTDDTTPADTDTDGEPADTDLDTDQGDTDPAPHGPPASWGGGLVDVSSAAILAADIPVFLGDPANMQSPQSTRAMFADLDGDGTPEVMVDESLYGASLQSRVLRIFRYSGTSGLLERDPALEALFAGARNDAMLGGLDLDGDGRDEILQESNDLVWWPDGEGGFEPGVDLTNGAILNESNKSTLSVLDVDQDGWLDLLVGSDHCEWSYQVLQRTGARSFDVRDDLITAPHPIRLLRAGAMRRGDGTQAILAMGTACVLAAPAPGGRR